MYDSIKSLLLKVLKVPPEPTDPMGDVGSLVVFRASKNYYKYRLFMWAIGLLVTWGGALIYLGLSYLGFVTDFRGDDTFGRVIFLVGEIIGVLGLLLGTIWSYLMLRLDYELRWYKVTDRSLRIREGVMAVSEMTMTFDNIQNISLTQGPVQRYLNIADLRVETAGGGGSQQSGSSGQETGMNMHVGYFRGIDNADDVLALMQTRLREARGSGLGDLDDEAEYETARSGHAPGALPAEVLAAASMLLDEARQMRVAAER